MPFAPLAARLAVRAAELRPVEGSRDDLAKFMALVMCAVLEMLICLCHALDARAVTDARLAEAPAARIGEGAVVAASRTGPRAVPGARRTCSPRLVPEVDATAPALATAPLAPSVAVATGHWLAWSREHGPIRAVPVPPGVAPSKNAVCGPGRCTPKSLRYRN